MNRLEVRLKNPSRIGHVFEQWMPLHDFYIPLPEGYPKNGEGEYMDQNFTPDNVAEVRFMEPLTQCVKCDEHIYEDEAYQTLGVARKKLFSKSKKKTKCGEIRALCASCAMAELEKKGVITKRKRKAEAFRMIEHPSKELTLQGDLWGQPQRRTQPA